jgi:hypothetical protein
VRDPRARWISSVAIAVFLLCMGAGCAPSTPDADSWRIDAQQAVSDAASAVHAAELALRLSQDSRVYDRYLQTVLVDAEEALGASGDAIGSKQPPEAERNRYDTVTGKIDDAASLASRTRIAVVDREEDSYGAWADQLAAAARGLQQLEDDLRHPVQASE